MKKQKNKNKQNSKEFIDNGIIKKKHKGYVFIRVGNQLIAEHRLVAEEILKRQLNTNETLHHIDHDRKNNNPTNLMLFENQRLHKHFENKELQFGKTRFIIEEINRRKITNLI